MPKPTGSLPDWDTSDTNTVEPSAGQKLSGYANNDVPTAANLNWWKRRVGLWIAYLNGLTAEALTWTAAHIFSALVTFNGDAVANGAVEFNGQTTFNDPMEVNEAVALSGGAGDVNPIMDSTGAMLTAKKLLWALPYTGAQRARLYASVSPAGVILTFNAYWDGSNWIPDVAGVGTPSYWYHFGTVSGLEVNFINSGAASFSQATVSAANVSALGLGGAIPGGAYFKVHNPLPTIASGGTVIVGNPGGGVPKLYISDGAAWIVVGTQT